MLDFNEYKLLKDKRSETWIKKIKNIFSAVSAWYSKNKYIFVGIGDSIMALITCIITLFYLREIIVTQSTISWPDIWFIIIFGGVSARCGWEAYSVFKKIIPNNIFIGL